MTDLRDPLPSRIAAARGWAERLERAAGPSSAARIRERLDALEEQAARGALSRREAEHAFHEIAAALSTLHEQARGETEAGGMSQHWMSNGPARSEILAKFASAVATDWVRAIAARAREAGIEPTAAEMVDVTLRAACMIAAGYAEDRESRGQPMPWTNRQVQALGAELLAQHFPAEADHPVPFPRGGGDHAAH